VGQQAATWTGIGVLSDAPDAPLLLIQLDQPWQPDDALDTLVRQLGFRPAQEVNRTWEELK
jgi:hypothetical protein